MAENRSEREAGETEPASESTEPETEAQNNLYYVVNCRESITLRTEPSTNAGEYCQIPLGDEVLFIDQAANGFCKVTYNGMTGYALSSYLSYTGQTAADHQGNTGRLLVANCRESITLRKTPSTGGEEICQLPLGTEVDFIGTAENGFYTVNYNGITGFALASYLIPIFEDGLSESALHIASDPLVYAYSDLVYDLSLLQEMYPEWVTVRVLAKTADGREIYDIIIGEETAEKQLLINAGIHAREYITCQLVMKQTAAFLKHLQNQDVYGDVSYRELLYGCALHIIPMVNPDGISISQFGLEGLQSEALRTKVSEIAALDGAEADGNYLIHWKANANGVDLNRNFDAQWESYVGVQHPSSDHYKGTSIGCEAESSALISLTQEMKFVRTISYHSQGNVIYWNYAQTGELLDQTMGLAQRISDITGYPLDGNFEEIDAAGYKDWVISKMQIPSLTIEVGTETSPVPAVQFFDIWERNRCVLEEVILDAKE